VLKLSDSFSHNVICLARCKRDSHPNIKTIDLHQPIPTDSQSCYPKLSLPTQRRRPICALPSGQLQSEGFNNAQSKPFRQQAYQTRCLIKFAI